MKKILFLILISLSSLTFAQDISFTFVNARNTNDGIDDFYEADIYISTDSDFKLGSGQIYFNYNTEAFGENVILNSNFEMSAPDGSILAEVYFFPAYGSFIVNDNTTSRVSTSFQQAIGSGTITADNVTSTPKHIYSIKFKYADVSKDPMVAFEDDESVVDMARDQFYTACGPSSGIGLADCTNEPGTQIQDANFDSSVAALPGPFVWTGTLGTSWDNASNWDTSEAPTADDDVEIPATANQPLINANSYEVNNVTMDTNTSLTITSGGTLIATVVLH